MLSNRIAVCGGTSIAIYLGFLLLSYPDPFWRIMFLLGTPTAVIILILMILTIALFPSRESADDKNDALDIFFAFFGCIFAFVFFWGIVCLIVEIALFREQWQDRHKKQAFTSKIKDNLENQDTLEIQSLAAEFKVSRGALLTRLLSLRKSLPIEIDGDVIHLKGGISVTDVIAKLQKEFKSWK